MGYPKMGGLFYGKSQSKVRMIWGYPYFRKPPFTVFDSHQKLPTGAELCPSRVYERVTIICMLADATCADSTQSIAYNTAVGNLG